MTEEEAKTKWCPYMQKCYVVEREFMATDGPTVEVHERTPKCIASDCMMWVHGSQYHNGYEVVTEPGRCGLVK